MECRLYTAIYKSSGLIFEGCKYPGIGLYHK